MKTDFRGIVTWLMEHPSTLEALRALIVPKAKEEEKQEREWLTLSRAAKRLDRSRSWLYTRLGDLPDEAKRKRSRGDIEEWVVDFGAVSFYLGPKAG